MDIIAHTASVHPSKEALRELRDNPDYTKLELDCHFTKDFELIWNHEFNVNGNLIMASHYHDLKGVLTLEDVLAILEGAKDFLIEIKSYPKEIQRKSSLLLKRLAVLTYYPKRIELESFHENFIGFLLKLQENGEISFLDLGLIINLFKTFKYRYYFPNQYQNIKFIALSNELFEWPLVGKDYQIYRKQLPEVRQYAWSWEAVYHETEARILNYLDKGVDEIATSNPMLVKKLIKSF